MFTKEEQDAIWEWADRLSYDMRRDEIPMLAMVTGSESFEQDSEDFILVTFTSEPGEGSYGPSAMLGGGDKLMTLGSINSSVLIHGWEPWPAAHFVQDGGTESLLFRRRK